MALALNPGVEGAVQRVTQSSLLVSCDMSHCVHPNYSEKYEADHQPRLHGGLVVKYNGNQSYGTNAVNGTIFRWDNAGWHVDGKLSSFCALSVLTLHRTCIVFTSLSHSLRVLLLPLLITLSFIHKYTAVLNRM